MSRLKRGSIGSAPVDAEVGLRDPRSPCIAASPLFLLIVANGFR